MKKQDATIKSEAKKTAGKKREGFAKQLEQLKSKLFPPKKSKSAKTASAPAASVPAGQKLSGTGTGVDMRKDMGGGKASSKLKGLLTKEIKIPGLSKQDTNKSAGKSASKSTGSSSKLLDKFREDYYPLIRERLEPAIAYYKSLNPREQLLAKIGGLAVAGYLALQLVLLPYLEFRQEIKGLAAAAYEDYSWLKSQESKINQILEDNGGSFDGSFDINALVKDYAPDAKIEQQPNGEYQISLTTSKGVLFFNSINAIVNRGGALLSFEFARVNNTPDVVYTALVKI